jgi:hypothetical protein
MKWFYTETYTHRRTGDRSFSNGVFEGNFRDLVLSVVGQSSSDEHYDDFALVGWKVIDGLDYDALDGQW